MLAYEDLPRKPNSKGTLTRSVLQLGLGHEALEILNAQLIHWMRAEECGRASPSLLAFVLRKSLPELNGLLRIITSPGHVDEPDIVRFGLLQATVWQNAPKGGP